MTAIAPSTQEDYYISTTKQREEEAKTKASETQDQVTHDDFLKLLTTQLTNQDPLNPMQDTEFVSQLAQLQTLDEQRSLAETMQGMRLDSQLQAGANLIGKRVSGELENGQFATGTVKSTTVRNGELLLNLADGMSMAYGMVESVEAAPVVEADGATATLKDGADLIGFNILAKDNEGREIRGMAVGAELIGDAVMVLLDNGNRVEYEMIQKVDFLAPATEEETPAEETPTEETATEETTETASAVG